MDQIKFVEQITRPASFRSTGITKEIYLDLMEMSFLAFTEEQIRTRKGVTGEPLTIQPYSRLTSVLACLLSAGRMTEYLALWEEMMTQCCAEIHTLPQNVEAEFAIKEIMLAYQFMKNHVSEVRRTSWLTELRKVDPYQNYRFVLRQPEDAKKLHNINIYHMVGEYLREIEGLTDTTDYFAKHWPVQLENFDQNGMYMDPGCPMLYDLTTRCQIQLMMGYGYSGEFAAAIDERLKKAGLMTLFTQSAAFAMPFGGRSNQYLFNEALITANAEYEATRYKKEGNLQLAGAFKRSGRLAIQSIRRWLEQSPPRHIKNMYPIESKYGTEFYGGYDKYMITMGSFLAIGYLFADDDIEEQPCPAEVGGYAIETSEAFHMIVANSGGYSIQVNTKGDLDYDATGLGLFHHARAPVELALASPLSGAKSYTLANHIERKYATIAPGWRTSEGTQRFLSELSSGLSHQLIIHEQSKDRVTFTITYHLHHNECEAVSETYQLDASGLKLEAELLNPLSDEIFMQIPVLVTNGHEETDISLEDEEIKIMLHNAVYQINFQNAQLRCSDVNYGNRNGQYRIAELHKKGHKVSLKMSLLSESTD